MRMYVPHGSWQTLQILILLHSLPILAIIRVFYLKRWCVFSSHKMQTVDLFCGCGGFTQGLVNAGFDVKMGIDYDDVILETYKNNFDHLAVKHNLQDWEGAVSLIQQHIPNVDIVVGSPPCTEFSRAGQQVENEIASLTVNFANIVTKILPRFFIMENVPDVFQSQSLSLAVDILNLAGYSVTSIVKDARYTGVPQNRRRFFMIGCAASEKNHELLSNIVNDSKKRQEIVSVKQYCNKIGIDCPEFLYFFPRNKFQAQVVDSKNPYPTMRSTNGVCMNKNPSSSTTPAQLKRPNDAADLNVAETLSIELASAISSFPKDFKWPENRKRVGIQLGNCVPPLLASWVGKLAAENLIDADQVPEGHGIWVMRPHEKTLKKTSHRDIFFKKIRENGGDDKHPSIHVHALSNTRGTTGAFRSESIASDPREIRYEMGNSHEVDDAATYTMGFPLKLGWTFIIKERICQKSRIDDLFVSVPGQPVPFRGKAMLVKNGLLSD